MSVSKIYYNVYFKGDEKCEYEVVLNLATPICKLIPKLAII